MAVARAVTVTRCPVSAIVIHPTTAINVKPLTTALTTKARTTAPRHVGILVSRPQLNEILQKQTLPILSKI